MKLTRISLIILLSMQCIIPAGQIRSQCTNCQGTTSSQANASSAVGIRTKASGLASFVSGFSSLASGEYSHSMGSRNISQGDFSFTIGSNAISLAKQSMVIGHGFGVSNADRLFNRIENSLMIGFNSIYPTLFISPADSRSRTGKLGIGNVTEPEAKLHIRADQGEIPQVFIEQPDFRSADLFLGNKAHGISSAKDNGLIFRTENNYIFDEGNVGIGTKFPEHLLHVKGRICTQELTLFDHELYQDNIAGWILRSDEAGRAFWTDPAQLSDDDWTMKEEHIYRLQGNVGIGTANPEAQLDLADIYPAGGINLKVGNDAYLTDVDRAHCLGIFSISEAEKGAIKLGNNGPVLFGNNEQLGIGTREPVTTLELNHDLYTGGTAGICLAHNDLHKWFIGMNGDRNNAHDLLIGNFSELHNGYSSFLVVNPNGNVGIGTDDTYSYKLAVNGAIITEEVTVKVRQNWPDYVFKPGYSLISLNQLDEYITQHGHLPGIPTQDEIKTNGLKVGEMESLLLQKVEELTLYIIEQNTRIREMEKELDLPVH